MTFALLFFLAAAIPAGVASWQGYNAAAVQHEQAALSWTALYADQLADDLADFESTQNSALGFAAGSGDLAVSLAVLGRVDGDTDHRHWQTRLAVLDRFSKRILEAYPVLEVAVLDAAGQAVYRSLPEPLDALGGLSRLRQALDGETVWDLAETWAVAAPVRAPGDDADISGALVLYLEPWSRAPAQEAYRFGPPVVYFVDADGQPLTIPLAGAASELAEPSLGDAPQILRAALQQPEAELRDDRWFVGYRGVHVLGSLRTMSVGGFPVGAAVELPPEQWAQPLAALQNRLIGWTVGLAAAAAVLGAVLGAWVSRYRPTRTPARLRKGEFAIKEGERKSDKPVAAMQPKKSRKRNKKST